MAADAGGVAEPGDKGSVPHKLLHLADRPVLAVPAS